VNGWQIAVLTGWAIAVWMFFSVLLSESGKFSDLGKSKLRWFLLSLAAFLPYIGRITTTMFRSRIRLPRRCAVPATETEG
jgi:hypothetical protein